MAKVIHQSRKEHHTLTKPLHCDMGSQLFLGPQFRSTSVQDSGIFVIHVDAGQDIISRLVSFCQTHNRITLIVSAFGYVSSPSILSCNRCFTYEGNYPIISLDGFLNPINAGGVNSSTLSLSMPGADGSLIGGRISNSLIAASQTIVVLGIFGPTAPVPHSSDLAPAPEETNDDSDATSA
ncbi:hypothetical protein F0562_025896 [Nyssa sinensis]|uniref:AT-hook motif nuclear-localized protein n=1 Tax=Nyssa sinensis TaxID=561372 RepID=A0A5J5B997_9ASTE|nr:hypothetical protein F0562_025896 [Nyssa sinensis]